MSGRGRADDVGAHEDEVTVVALRHGRAPARRPGGARRGGSPPRCGRSPSGDVRSAVPGAAWPALDTMMSIGPSASVAARGEFLHRVRLGQVETVHVGFAARGSDARRHLLAPLDPARPEHHGVARPRPGPRPTAAPIPEEAPATTDGRRRGWATKRSGHRSDPCAAVGRAQRAVTVVGRLANPRTLMEWTRRAPAASMS